MLNQVEFCNTNHSAVESRAIGVDINPQKKIPSRKPECLLDRIHAGDSSAESTFANLYWLPLNSYFKSKCNDAFLADDLTQDTVLLALVKCREGAIRDKSALKSFVYGIGRNVMLTHFRKNELRATSPDAEIEECGLADQITPEHKACLQNSIELTQMAISNMTVKRDKMVLNLFYFSKKSKQHICERFSLTSEHFDRVLFRARDRLTKQVWEDLEGAADIIPNHGTKRAICKQLFI